MRRVAFGTALIMAVGLGYLVGRYIGEGKETHQIVATPIPTPLAKYQIEKLASAQIRAGIIEISENIKKEELFESYLFKMSFDPELNGKENKLITGLINMPSGDEKYPVVLMIRGYVDQESYETGMGTKNAAEAFAQAGMITIAPDFLGYGGSSMEADNIFETRLQTYTTVLSLINAVEQIEKWDGKNILIWGHSNGGQIALTILTITGEDYPTSLWAPVSKPFPYNVLYYTDESDDGGKMIRRELAKMEEVYNTSEFSFTNYLDRIRAPLQIQQGTADEAVPARWSDELAEKLKEAKVEVDYISYFGADHNLRPKWNEAVERDINFFRSQFK